MAQSDSTLKEFVGKYHFPDGSVVTEATVVLDNGILCVLTSAGNSILEKTSTADVFAITSFQGMAAFKRNDAKKIVGVIIDAMGYHLEGTKDNGIAFDDKFLKKMRLNFSR